MIVYDGEKERERKEMKISPKKSLLQAHTHEYTLTQILKPFSKWIITKVVIGRIANSRIFYLNFSEER